MWALLSLAVGSFGIGMTEFVVMGLLPNIAEDLLPVAVGDALRGRDRAGRLAHLAVRARRRGRCADDRRRGGEVPAPSRHDRARARAHGVQRADLPRPDVRMGRGIPVPRRTAARRVLRHRRSRRRRGARPRHAGEGRGVRADRPHRRQRGGRPARHLPRTAGGLARRVHGGRGDLRRGDDPHRVLRARASRATRAAPCAPSSRSSGSVRCGSRSGSARSASAASSRSTATSPRW